MDLNQIIRSRYSINDSIDRWILEWFNWSNNVSMFVQTSCVKKIITIINIIHLIRAIIDTTRYKTRWKFIAPLLSLPSASEYLLEFEKNTLHCLRAALRTFIHLTFSLFLRLIFVYEKINQSKIHEILITNYTERTMTV